jgi:DNA-binding MarR family transcriptional regulator
MQNKDLIDRALDETNRRRIKVTTTKKSEAMKTSLLEAVEELNREISKGYTKKEWNTFLEMLYKIGNIEEK